MSPGFIAQRRHHGRRRRPRSSAAVPAEIWAKLPGVPAPAQADDGAPRRAVGRDDAGARRTSAPQAPAINRFVIALGPFAKASTPALTSLGEALGAGPQGADRRQADRAGPQARSASRSSRWRRNLVGAADEPAQHRRHRAPDGLPLLPGGRGQRLRLLRPLPARAADRQHLHDLPRCSNDPSCTANFQTSSARLRRHATTRSARPSWSREDRVDERRERRAGAVAA